MLKLSDVFNTFQDVNNDSTAFFNKKNEILWKWDYNSEYSTYKEDAKFDDDIICMFDFIYTTDDEDLKETLLYETRGKNVFKKFRNIIDYNNLTSKWYEYRDNRYKEIAREWCVDNNIEFEEDC